MPAEQLTAIIQLAILGILLLYLLFVLGSVVSLLRQILDEIKGLRMDRTREKITRQ